jgi:hypothetical protein
LPKQSSGPFPKRNGPRLFLGRDRDPSGIYDRRAHVEPSKNLPGPDLAASMPQCFSSLAVWEADV